METITIKSIKGHKEWFAYFSTMDNPLPTPFFLTMAKQDVIDKIQALNPNSKVN